RVTSRGVPKHWKLSPALRKRTEAELEAIASHDRERQRRVLKRLIRDGRLGQFEGVGEAKYDRAGGLRLHWSPVMQWRQDIVVYARFSSDRQREASSEDQARNCRRRIEAEGWQLMQHFKDEGITGSTSERPAYKAMLRAAASGEFGVLLVDDLSRLSSDQIES